MGRLTREANINYTQGQKPMCIASYTLAVDRKFKRDGEPTADFIQCKAFGKNGEFIEKYCTKGTKLVVKGHIQTGSYTNRDGQKVYTTEIMVDEQEFAESKASAQQNQQQYQPNGGQQYSAPQNQPTQQYAPQPQPTPQMAQPQPAPQYQQQQMQFSQPQQTQTQPNNGGFYTNPDGSAPYNPMFGGNPNQPEGLDGFMNIPDGLEEQLPFA